MTCTGAFANELEAGEVVSPPVYPVVGAASRRFGVGLLFNGQ